MSGYTIKDLETLSGIKAHTIRMWEQRYNFLRPKRSCTNIRYYNNEELKTLLNIALLNKYGFKISHIDRMKPDEICEKVLSLRECCAVQDRIINEMVKEMSNQSQFILITHNKRTMEVADTLYGVTMQEPGISKLVSVKIRQAHAENDNVTAA